MKAEGRWRPGRDPLGLRRAMADRLLQALIAAMVLLACLGFAGIRGVENLAARWRTGAEAALTIQVPEPSRTRMALALGVLATLPEVAEANPVDPERLAALLRPWLGEQADLPMPGVIEVRLASPEADVALIGDRVAEAVPGAVTEAHGPWVGQLMALVDAIQGAAYAALVLVGLIAVAVVAVATRAAIAARRDSVEVMHQLGAGDAEIAGHFARRAALLALGGGVVGSVAAVPVFFLLARIAQPLGAEAVEGLAALPWAILPWRDIVLVPLMAGLIGWLTTQAVVRLWLARLP